MRGMILIVLNDLRRRARKPLSVLLMLLIPVTITLIIGLVFGGSGEAEMPRIKVLLADRDGGFMSRFIRQGMGQGELAEMIELVDTDPEEAAEMMEEGEASAMIEIPEGFTSDVLDGRPSVIRVVKNPSEAFLPLIAEEITGTLAVILDGALRVFSGPVSDVRSMLDGEGWPEAAEMQSVFEKARAGMILAEDYVSGSLITLKEETVGSEGEGGGGGINIFAWVLPGSMMLGLLFISELVLRDIIREQRSGTLSRALSAPLETAHFVGGKIGATFAITFAACLVLLLVGRFGFSMDLGRPLPLLVHTVASILMCTGLMTFLYGLVRSERAADAIMSVAIIILAMLGGSMMPVQSMPGAMQRVAMISPVYWASRGYQRVFIEEAGLSGISTEIIVLFAVGALTLAPGILLIRNKVRKGGW